MLRIVIAETKIDQAYAENVWVKTEKKDNTIHNKKLSKNSQGRKTGSI